VAAALTTLTALSIIGIATSLVLALAATTSADVGRHVLLGVFSTLLNLLAHSLMMFYLIGKGKAVREAVTEGALDKDYVVRVSRLRAPVVSRATLAMALTMAAAIIGASVDVRVLPRWPHTMLAIAALAANLYALVAELMALTGSARVVDEVNSRLGAHG
jgi:hypothetical protein